MPADSSSPVRPEAGGCAGGESRAAAALRDLVDTLGEAVSTAPAALAAARRDRSGLDEPGEPLAVVDAASTEDVQATLRIASAHGIPVVPRGAGTGLAGGASGTDGSIVLSVARMNRIVEISPEDEIAVVQPGVINQDLDDAVAPFGLWFAPDPASKAISSIGGNIATNAGGLLCAKYGVTREAVLGLTVVLADGTLLRTGRRTVKGVAGLDLTALLVGSEGTLGVIVEAIVRLRPAQSSDIATIGGFFPSTAGAAAAAAAITAARIRPSVMEIIDAPALAHIRRFLGPASFDGLPVAADGSAYLLVQTDSASTTDADGRAEDARILASVVASGGDATLTRDAEVSERLLAIRRAFHGSLEALGDVLIEDVCVPRSRMPEMFDAIDRISREHGIDIPTVAHAGDGNLHPNFVVPSAAAPGAAGTGAADQVPEYVWRAADALFRAAIELGGTLTGEHGVGILKSRWLADELGDTSDALQRRIKDVFDPAGILNPGKVFEATR